jgi:hypothetical protein
MNKDKQIMSFEIIKQGDLEACIEVKRYGEMPFWFTNINDWIQNRSVAKHRRHVKDILRNCGGDTQSGFIALTHCLSINDTLWVKEDCESVMWKDVSLYTNKFNDVISKLSFDGTGLCGQNMSTTSPELTTDGAFDKCWIRESDNNINLIKAGSTGASNAGLEPYSEVVSSQIYNKLCKSVEYTLYRYNGKVTSKCKLFTTEQYGFKSAAACGFVNEPILLLLKRYGEYDCEDMFRRMLIGDAITVNTDRHYGNFGFMIDNDTFEKVSMAPIFDFNLAMFPYADWYEGFSDMDKWISDRGPSLGNSYYNVAKDMMTPSIHSDLINLKDLTLTVDTDDKFTKNRLNIINRFKNVQINRLLGNWKQFDFTDLRDKAGDDLLVKALGNMRGKEKV